MTGLTTPKNTYQSGEYGRSRNFRSRTRASMGLTLDDDDDEHGSSAYVMNGIQNPSQTDGESLEEDQKHILKGSGDHGDWITKTTEYTVSHDTRFGDNR